LKKTEKIIWIYQIIDIELKIILIFFRLFEIAPKNTGQSLNFFLKLLTNAVIGRLLAYLYVF